MGTLTYGRGSRGTLSYGREGQGSGTLSYGESGAINLGKLTFGSHSLTYGGLFSDPDFRNLESRIVTPMSANNRLAMAMLIRDLKAAGVWGDLDTIQVINDTQQASLLCLKNSGNDATLTGTVAYTANRWFLPDGSTGYYNTNVRPAQDTTQASLNSTSFGLFSSTAYGVLNVAGNGQGPTYNHLSTGPSQNPATGFSIFFTAAESIAFQGMINGDGNALYTASGLGVPGYGALTLERTDASTLQFYADGALKATGTPFASTSVLSNLNLLLNVFSANGSVAFFGRQRLSAFWYGRALGATKNAALAAALNAYMQRIGNWMQPVKAWGDSQSQPGTWRSGMWWRDETQGRPIRLGVTDGVPGETSGQILAHMQADTTYRNTHIHLIWAGRNDINNTAQTVDSTSILNNVAAMVALAQAGSGKYLVLPPCRANLNAAAIGDINNSELTGTPIGNALNSLKATLASTYGANYLDIEQAYIDWALVSNNGIGTPTANDIADANAGMTPRGLLADRIHKNIVPIGFGNVVTGYAIAAKLAALYG